MSPPQVIVASELPGRRRRSRHGRRGRGASSPRATTPDRRPLRSCSPSSAAERARGPTMLAADAARELERRLRDAGLAAAARGRLCWLRLARETWCEQLVLGLEAAEPARAAVVHVPSAELPPGDRARRPWSRPPRCCGPTCRPSAPWRRWRGRAAGPRDCGCGSRPALRAGSRRGGRSPASTRAARPRAARARLAHGLVGASAQAAASRPAGHFAGRLAAESGQALPLALGGVLALIFCALLLAALGGAATGKSRAQRAADLSALSAARSMRDDFERLFVAARMPDGSPNPRHLTTEEYLRRASLAAARGGEAKRRRAGAAAGRVPGRRLVRPAARANGDRRVAGRRRAAAGADRGRGRGRGGRRRRAPRRAAGRRPRAAAATRGRSPTARASRCAPTWPRPSTGSPRRRPPTGWR